MHGFASYRRFGKARWLRNDQNVHVLGHYVVTKLGSELGRYIATEPCACLVSAYWSSLACPRSDYHARARPWPVGYVFVVLGQSVFGSTEIRIRFYRKALRKDFFTKITFRKSVHADFYGLSDIDSVVTNFDPNIYSSKVSFSFPLPALKPS